MNNIVEQATALLLIIWYAGLTVLEKYWPLFLVIGITCIIYSAVR